MKKIDNPEQVNVSLYSNIPLSAMLYDYRAGRVGIKFGTVIDLCNQFGITIEQLPKCIKFTAPKLRLQKFMERLHFSRNRYWA